MASTTNAFHNTFRAATSTCQRRASADRPDCGQPVGCTAAAPGTPPWWTRRPPPGTRLNQAR